MKVILCFIKRREYTDKIKRFKEKIQSLPLEDEAYKKQIKQYD